VGDLDMEFFTLCNVVKEGITTRWIPVHFCV